MSTTTDDAVRSPAGRTGPPGATPAPSTHGLSVTGGVLGLAFAAMSVTQSLVPRGWLIQAALVGVCVVTGYGIGAFLGWVYRSLELPDGARRVVWRVLGLTALVGLPVAAWLGRGYQSEQLELLGIYPSVPWPWLLAPWLALVVAALLTGVGPAVGAEDFSLALRFLPPPLPQGVTTP